VVGRCRSNEPLAGAKHPRGVLQGVRFGAGRSRRFEEDTVGAHVDEGQRPEGAAGETLGTGAGRERSTPELGAGSLRSSRCGSTHGALARALMQRTSKAGRGYRRGWAEPLVYSRMRAGGAQECRQGIAHRDAAGQRR
jgi:hypothetical protein